METSKYRTVRPVIIQSQHELQVSENTSQVQSKQHLRTNGILGIGATCPWSFQVELLKSRLVFGESFEFKVLVDNS